MNTQGWKNAFGKPVVIGLVMLWVGLLIGLAAAKYVVPAAVPAAQGQTAAAGSPGVGTRQIPAPDMLFPGANDAWDPFREMRDLQAEMRKPHSAGTPAAGQFQSARR